MDSASGGQGGKRRLMCAPLIIARKAITGQLFQAPRWSGDDQLPLSNAANTSEKNVITRAAQHRRCRAGEIMTACLITTTFGTKFTAGRTAPSDRLLPDQAVSEG